MKRLVSLLCALAGAAACGDNLPADDDGIDAPEIDAPSPDAPTDAPTDARIDAAPVRFSGTITLLEAQVLNPSPGPVNTIFGEGIQLGITFSDATVAVAPILDTAPGTLFGCKVTILDTPAELLGSVGVDEGNVDVTITSTPAAPTFPTCRFVAGLGYICPDFGSSQSTGLPTPAITVTDNVTITTMTAGATALMTLTATSNATFGAEDVGRYVKFNGTGIASLDASIAAIPIVGIASNKIAVLALPLPAATTIPVTQGVFSTLAGVGPTPSLMDPGQLGDAASATAVLTAGGGNHFATTTVTYGDMANDFTMDDTNADRLRNIPRDGTAFSINCATCGDGIGSILAITTTNASLAGITSPFAMPTGTARTSIRCAAVGVTQIDVPANVSAFIMSSGATRIQANYVRGKFGAAAPANEGLAGVISGHVMVGFTTPP